jgi:hypothetical protein
MHKLYWRPSHLEPLESHESVDTVVDDLRKHRPKYILWNNVDHRPPEMNQPQQGPERSLRWPPFVWLVGIIFISMAVRAGTGFFMATHLEDPGWFQSGSYAWFDSRARNILAGTEPVLLLTDPSRTDLIQHPPGFPLFVASIYAVTGEHSAAAVLNVQLVLDALIVPLLLVGISVTAFGWKPSYAAGIFGGLSPVLAVYGVTPTAEAVTNWALLGALWLLLVAVQRMSSRIAFVSGVLLGVSCWFRVNPLLLVVAWTAAIMLLRTLPVRRRVGLCGGVLLGTILVVAPIVVRNMIVYREFVLTGLNMGTRFWEGLGETEFGRANGFILGDHLLAETERADLGLPPDVPISLVWPDGIRRDRVRMQRALSLIGEHPIWYAGVMFERMYWLLKLSGSSGPYSGFAGFNCTPAKCLPEGERTGFIAIGITVLGMAQSVYRHFALLFAVIGIIAGLWRNPGVSMLLLAPILYYLISTSAAHAEMRDVVPMHSVLIVFSGLGFVRIVQGTTQIAAKTRKRLGER